MNHSTKKNKGTASIKKDINKFNDEVKKSVFQKYRVCYNSGDSKGKKELSKVVGKKKSDKQEAQKIKKKEINNDSHFNHTNELVSNNREETNDQKPSFNVNKYYEKVKKWNRKRTEGTNCEKKKIQNTLINEIKKEKENITNINEVEHHTSGKRKFNNNENKNIVDKKEHLKNLKQVPQYEKCLREIRGVENYTCQNRELKCRKIIPKDTADKKIYSIYKNVEVPKFEVNLCTQKPFFTSNERNCSFKNENTRENEKGYSTQSQHSEIIEQETISKNNSNSKKSYETILLDVGKDLYSNKTFMNSNDNFDISNYALNASNYILKSNHTYINNLLDVPTLPSENESEANSYFAFLKQEHAENERHAQTQTKAVSSSNNMRILLKSSNGKLENAIREDCSNDIKEIQNFGNKINTKGIASYNISYTHLDIKGENIVQNQWSQDASDEFLDATSSEKPDNTIHLENGSDTTPESNKRKHILDSSSGKCKKNEYNKRVEKIKKKSSVLNDYENAGNSDVPRKDIRTIFLSGEHQQLSYENKKDKCNIFFEDNHLEAGSFEEHILKKDCLQKDSFQKDSFQKDSFQKDIFKSELHNSQLTEKKKRKNKDNNILKGQEYDEVNVEKARVVYNNLTKNNDIKTKYIYDEKKNNYNISTNNIVPSDEKERLIKTEEKIMSIKDDPLHDLYDNALDFEINTHKKLIEIPTKKIENNFDILLCLLMKNEQKESFVQCLLLDKELTEHSYFFQTQIKPIFEDYKKAKFQKIKERNNDANCIDYDNIKPNKIVLQILTTTINHKYLDHITYLYNIKKKKQNWKTTSDMEREMKEVNKKLRNKETKTVGITKKWNNYPSSFIGDYETKVELIEKPQWSNKKNLEELLKKQQNYNPFTIFGTSIKEVNLEEIFTLDVYNNYVTNEDRYKNKILYELYCRDHINNLYKQIEPFEWKIVIDTLQKSWKYFINLECNMSLDPLLLEEILWYIDINKMYKDQSKKMFIYETCFCPTPDPTRTNNLNDFKNFAISMDTKCIAYRCHSKKKYNLHAGRDEPLKKKEEEDKEKMEWNVEDEDWEILENDEKCTDEKCTDKQWAITYNDTKEWKNKKRTTTKQLVFTIPRPSGSICYYSDYFQSKILKNIVEQMEMCDKNTHVNAKDNDANTGDNNDNDTDSDGNNTDNDDNTNNKNESPPIPKSSRVVEDVFLKDNDIKEWTSQNFFDNFFFNYYLYNFDRCNCRCNSII